MISVLRSFVIAIAVLNNSAVYDSCRDIKTQNICVCFTEFSGRRRDYKGGIANRLWSDWPRLLRESQSRPARTAARRGRREIHWKFLGELSDLSGPVQRYDVRASVSWKT